MLITNNHINQYTNRLSMKYRYLYFIMLCSLIIGLVMRPGISEAASDSKYKYLPDVIQSASFPLKESFYHMSTRKDLNKRTKRKINRYLDIDPKRVFNDKRISEEEKKTEPLVYIALSQFNSEPVLLADKWGLSDKHAMYHFVVGLDAMKHNVMDIHAIELKEFQERLEKPLIKSILLSGHLDITWEEYQGADIGRRQEILYAAEFVNASDVNTGSYSMYVLSVCYTMMFRNDNNPAYGKENFDLLIRIFDVVKELKSVYDPNNPLLYFITKRIGMRF